MPRIIGVDIPENKRIEVALTYIYGIGSTNVKQILSQANIDPNTRAKDLTSQDINKLQKILDKYNVEGTLRQQIRENIQRLKRIGSYRGMRHAANLPSRGQRTRVNARTRRGKRRTVGAMKKDELAKLEAAKK